MPPGAHPRRDRSRRRRGSAWPECAHIRIGIPVQRFVWSTPQEASRRGLAFPEWAQLDTTVLRIGYPGGPHDGLIEILAVEDQYPAELFSGLSEGPIGK